MQSTAAFFVIGALCLLACVLYFIKAAKLKKTCTARCDARIIEVDRHHRDKRNEYIPVYEYRINGVTYNARGNSTTSRKKYKVGYESFVIYNPDKPSDCLIEGKNTAGKTGFVFIFLGALFLAFGFFL